MAKEPVPLLSLARVALLGVLALAGLGTLEEAADWAWSIPMRPRLDHLYSLERELRPRMPRSEVEAAVHTGRSSEPGPCPGAPPNWARLAVQRPVEPARNLR